MASIPLVLVLVGCGSDEDPKAEEPSLETTTSTADSGVTTPVEVVDLTGDDVVEIEVEDGRFDPAAFRVDPRARIVFRNAGGEEHDITPSEVGAFTPIRAEDLGPGEASTLVLDEPGYYPFHCSLHDTPTDGELGTIVVGVDHRQVE